jgi:hypothetical protein
MTARREEYKNIKRGLPALACSLKDLHTLIYKTSHLDRFTSYTGLLLIFEF